MPTYEYKCKECDSTFSVMQSIWARKKAKCPSCGSENAEKLISHFNASGGSECGGSSGSHEPFG